MGKQFHFGTEPAMPGGAMGRSYGGSTHVGLRLPTDSKVLGYGYNCPSEGAVSRERAIGAEVALSRTLPKPHGRPSRFRGESQGCQ